jgi:hypothetical protein
MALRAAASFRRLFLRSIAWTAEDRAVSLADGLKAAARATMEDTATGKVLVSATANGTALSYLIPAAGAHVSPQDIAEIVEDFLARYDNAVATLDDPTDAEILAEMLAGIVAKRVKSSDFSGLIR